MGQEREMNQENKVKKIITLAAPPIQYFWADSQGVLMTNSPVLES